MRTRTPRKSGGAWTDGERGMAAHEFVFCNIYFRCGLSQCRDAILNMLHKAFNPPKIYIKSLSGIPSEFLPRHAAAHRRSGTGSRLRFVLPCRFGFCFTVYYNKCRWDAQSVRAGFRRFFRLKIGFFSMRHRLTGVHEPHKRFAPNGRLLFSAPTERGTRTAAGVFALTGRLLSLHRLSGVLELR